MVSLEYKPKRVLRYVIFVAQKIRKKYLHILGGDFTPMVRFFRLEKRDREKEREKRLRCCKKTTNCCFICPSCCFFTTSCCVAFLQHFVVYMHPGVVFLQQNFFKKVKII
jgi:hypothetical protein